MPFAAWFVQSGPLGDEEAVGQSRPVEVEITDSVLEDDGLELREEEVDELEEVIADDDDDERVELIELLVEE